MTEEARHQLYEAPKERIGVAPANTLMDAIPPVGWADVATKRDLDMLRLEMRSELHALRAEMAARMSDLQRNLFLGLITVQAAIGAVILNAVG